MKTKIFPSLLALFLLALLIPIAYAQIGCFTHVNSPFYCSDLDAIQAQQECSIYEDCILEQNFFPDQTCIDVISFPECSYVNCKSSCQPEISGLCLAGEIPAGEETQWCSPGCCMFPYYGGDYCEYQANKWLCENDAQNKGASNLAYFTEFSEEQCTASCSTGAATQADLEPVTPPQQVVSPEQQIIQNTTEPAYSGSNWWWLLAVLVLVAVVFLSIQTYLKWENLFGSSKSTFNPEEPSSRQWSGFSSKSEPVRIRIGTPANVIKNYSRKDRLRKSYLMDAGLSPIKVKENPFAKLEKLVRFHKPAIKQKPTEKLKEVISKSQARKR
jgi:hypothetical protein